MSEDERPVLRIYRTNGWLWARFDRFSDGTEEPADIFGNEEDMLHDARNNALPAHIEFRPQELGNEGTEEERTVADRLAELFDARIAAAKALRSFDKKRDLSERHRR